MTQDELSENLMIALLNFVNQSLNVDASKTYKITGKFKFKVDEGKLTGLDVKSINVRES
jgi:hypothetical protein